MTDRADNGFPLKENLPVVTDRSNATDFRLDSAILNWLGIEIAVRQGLMTRQGWGSGQTIEYNMRESLTKFLEDYDDMQFRLEGLDK